MRPVLLVAGPLPRGLPWDRVAPSVSAWLATPCMHCMLNSFRGHAPHPHLRQTTNPGPNHVPYHGLVCHSIPHPFSLSGWSLVTGCCCCCSKVTGCWSKACWMLLAIDWPQPSLEAAVSTPPGLLLVVARGA